MERSQAYLGATTSVLQRVLLAFRTVKASRTERTEAAAFDEKVRGSYRAGVRAARTEAIADTGARGGCNSETVGPGPQPVVTTRAHPPAPALRLDRVSFSYRDRRVLRDISLEAAPGLTVLVGPSGTGKTTLLSLIERFVAPTDGRILLDGEDIRHLDLADLRARVSYVEQEAHSWATPSAPRRPTGLPTSMTGESWQHSTHSD